MPRSFGDAPRQSATDIAAALMEGDGAQDTAAPESTIEETRVEEVQPERGRARRADGRFAPREESVPTEPMERTQAELDTTVEPQTPDELAAARAELARQQAENERLRRTYEQNTIQQREALRVAREEAEALKAAKQAERQSLLEQARAEVAAIPDNTIERFQAERQLAQIEREEANRVKAEIEAERQEQDQARQARAQSQADLAARTGLWGVVEAYAATYSQEHGLPDEEALAALESLKTPELAILFRTMEPTQLISHVKGVVGHRLHDELERRRATLGQRQAQETEANRQQALAEGAHTHIHIPGQTSPQPAYAAFTRENKAVRLGRAAAVDAILAGVLGVLDE